MGLCSPRRTETDPKKKNFRSLLERSYKTRENMVLPKPLAGKGKHIHHLTFSAELFSLMSSHKYA